MTKTARTQKAAAFDAFLSRLGRAFLVSVLLLLASGRVAYSTTYTWNGSSGNWTTSTDWTPSGGPPGPSDTAIINSGTVTVSSAVTVGALTMSGGTLTGSSVTAGSFYWSGGYIENTVGFDGGTNGGNCFLDGGQLINDGTWNWNGTIYDGAGSTISNNGTMNITNFTDSQTFYFTYNEYGAPYTFYNAGVVNVTAGTGNTGVIYDSLVNSGEIYINPGTLDLANGGTNSVQIAAEYDTASLEFSGGTFVCNNSAYILIDGNLIFSGGTVNVENDATVSVDGTNIFSGATVTVTSPDYPINTPMVVSGGTVNLDGNNEVWPTTMAMSGGTLTGGPVKVLGPFYWSGGYLENMVQFEGGTNGGNCFLDGGQLINEGTWGWNGTIYDGGGSIISNAPSATMNLENLADSQTFNFTYNEYGAPYTFYNAGQVTVSAEPGDTGVIFDTLVNSGVITTFSGTLNLANGGTNSGDIEADIAQTTLEFSAGTFLLTFGSLVFSDGNLIFSGGTVNVEDDAAVSVDGTNIFSGATVTVTSPDYPIDTPMVISGGMVNLDGNNEVWPTTMAMSGGTLTGGPVKVLGPFYWSGGYLENMVQFEGGTNGGNCFLDGGQLINEGTWGWNGTIYDGGGSIISNAPSATMNLENLADSRTFNFTYNEYGAPYTFYNAGQVTVSAEPGDTGVIFDAFTNYGTMTISNGTLSLSQTPNLENGTLNFCISNLTSYGSISLGSGAANLGGTLTATVINPAFVAATGDEWPVIAYGSVAGNFSNIVLPPIGDWEETANASDYVIEIKQTGPAPFIAQNLSETNFALAGGPAVMSVQWNGTPPFTNQWYSEIGGVTNALQNGGRISGATTNVLTIAYAQTNDDGPYQLFVTNGFAPYSDVSGVGQLEVELEPLFNGNGALWTLNGGATIQNNVLTLTDGQQDEARSAFYYVPMYYPAFRAFFTYQSAQGTTASKADGITFCLQNTTAGTGALGTGGGSLGYKGITNSVAIAFEQFITNGIEYVTNGADPANPAHYIGTAPVLPDSGDPINVSILYETNAFFLSMTDTVTMGAFATNFVLNLPPITGTNQAFVGFTGGDGDLDSVQTISNFTFVPLPFITAKSSGPNVLLTWPTAIGGFQLQSATNLLTGPWVMVPVSDYGAAQGALYQITVPSNGKNQFYRLMLPANWAQVP